MTKRTAPPRHPPVESDGGVAGGHRGTGAATPRDSRTARPKGPANTTPSATMTTSRRTDGSRRDGHRSGRRGGPAGGDNEIGPLPFGMIGAEIRRLRLLRGISLRSFAKQTGLSPGFVSLLERGKSSVGLNSLGQIARELDTSLFRLMESPVSVDEAYREPFVVREDGLARALIQTGRMEYRLLSSAWPRRTLEAMLVTVTPHMPPMGTPHGHAGEEFGYVVRGEVVFMVDDQEHILREGDSIHMQSGVPHEIRNDQDDSAQVLYVSTSRLLG